MPDFDMGKYGFYIWASYGALAVVFGWMIADSLASAARWKREAARLEAEREAKKAKIK